MPQIRGHDAISFVPGTFRPDRIRSIAERFGVNPEMALENILYGLFSLMVQTELLTPYFHPYTIARAYNSENQVSFVH